MYIDLGDDVVCKLKVIVEYPMSQVGSSVSECIESAKKWVKLNRKNWIVRDVELVSTIMASEYYKKKEEERRKVTI